MGHYECRVCEQRMSHCSCSRAPEPAGSLRWLADHDDPESVDDLFVGNATRVRMERMSEDAYWLSIEVDGKQYNIDLFIRGGSRSKGTKRRIVAFNRGELPNPEQR